MLSPSPKIRIYHGRSIKEKPVSKSIFLFENEGFYDCIVYEYFMLFNDEKDIQKYFNRFDKNALKWAREFIDSRVRKLV